jgi:hypothetical protein
MIDFVSLESLNLDVLSNAVIFFHARWSAPSAMALRELTDGENFTNAAPLYVIDIDTTTPEAIRAKFGFISHGRGETVRIRDGGRSVAFRLPSNRLRK